MYRGVDWVDDSHAPALSSRRGCPTSQGTGTDGHQRAATIGVLLARLRGQPRPQPGFAAEVPDLILGTQSIGSWDLWTVGPSRLSSLV